MLGGVSVSSVATAFFSEETARFLLLGLATGSLYALVALGIVIVYRASGVLNFAAAALGAVAAYVFYWLRDDQSVYWVPAFIIAILVGGMLGAFTQFVVMRVLAKVSVLGKLIATLGLLVVAQAFVALVFGSETFVTTPVSILPVDLIKITDVITLPAERLIIIGLVLIFAVALRLLYSKTMFGLVTSAVAENRRVASASGWSPSRVELTNFVLAGMLSALAAILLAPIVTLEVSVISLTVIPALAAALVGRFSSFAITVGTALVVGVITAELSFFSPDVARILGVPQTGVTGLPQIVPLLIIVLVVAFSGRARLERGEVLARLPLPGSGNVAPGPLLLGFAVGMVALFVLNPQWDDALITTLGFAMLLLSVVVVAGYAGQLSLCQFALAGFGGWAAARLVATQGLPFELAPVAGILATVLLGLLVALPALRTRGVNLAIATLALALMINAIVLNNAELTGGFFGTVVDRPTLFGIDIDATAHPDRYGAFLLILLVLVGLVVSNVRRGRAGRRLLAVRSNERAAASLGVGVYGAKLYAFGLSSGIAGLAGVLFAFRSEHINFQRFDVFGSINAILYGVLGGIGWASGATIGAFLAPGALFSNVTRVLFGSIEDINTWLLLVSGIGVIAMLKQAPDGIASLLTRQLTPVLGVFRRRLPARAEPRSVTEAVRERHPVELMVHNISVAFGGVVALDDVSFTVHPGEVLGLIGPNGAGKTTMLDVITGFTPRAAGSVVLDGQPIDTWSPERRARAGIARSWQGAELFEEMTVRENLLVAADRQRIRRYFTDLVWPGRVAMTEAMHQVVDDFELGDYLDMRPAPLPHGTGRIVSIARAIASEPRVLLLDEPAAGLDVIESAELSATIRRIARELGIGVLLIEHDVSLLLATCDRIVVLDFGRWIAEGTPDEIARNPAVIQAYLGEPSGSEAAPTH
jgi:ABC-type branched-subunit amino acid transport system ATPase component/ABC-type branched-subunit amino acid transport system permease subunit